MSVSARARARRRRLGAVLAMASLVALGLAWSLPWGPDRTSSRPGAAPAAAEEPVGGGSPTPAGEPTDQEAPADPAPTPAWLAWVPGGFPAGFTRAVRDDPAFSATVVVAGDTGWMTASRDADGRWVDRPEPPFGIPIDAFAVDPVAYAPFLEEDGREAVLDALARGEAVLGRTSADLRGIGPGGSLVFGDVVVRVGAVAPDEAVGWAEVLVNRRVGARLGIEHDRYLLALGDLTLHRFGSGVRSHLTPGTPLRVEAPGEAAYVRVASGVNPPVVMKETFGEFAATPRQDDPAFLTLDPAWYDEHIVTARVPILGEVTCHERFLRPLRAALAELVALGLDDLISVNSGCYAARTVARSDSAPPSQHAYGAAIDIDAPTNGYGDPTPAMDPRVVTVFERHGLIWGGDFLIPDGMHFEFGSRPDRDG